MNNPLIFTDPSGNTWLSQFGDWISGGFNNLRTWMNNNPMQFGFTYGDNGTIPFISFPVKGNTNLSVGYNITTGQPGIGNNSSGFTNFYYPFHKTITPEEIGGDAYNEVRTPFNMNEWQAASSGGWDSNGDGKLQKNEADKHWLNGGGGISVDNSKINWTGLQIPTSAKVGKIFSISTTQAFLKLPYETAATYGGTSFILRGAYTVEVVDQLYHYQYRPNNSAENIMRNFMNWYGKPEGHGTDFMIHYNNPLIIIK